MSHFGIWLLASLLEAMSSSFYKNMFIERGFTYKSRKCLTHHIVFLFCEIFFETANTQTSTIEQGSIL